MFSLRIRIRTQMLDRFYEESKSEIWQFPEFVGFTWDRTDLRGRTIGGDGHVEDGPSTSSSPAACVLLLDALHDALESSVLTIMS